MKRKLIMMLLFSLVFVGCGADKNKNGTTIDNESIPEEKTPVEDEEQVKEPNRVEEDNKPIKPESFLKENYVSFPEVRNIVSYLKKKPKDVKILNQTSKRLVFCLKVGDVDVNDESIISIYNYVRLLEKDGYKMRLLDATISQTFILEKGDYTLSITPILVIDEWKEIYKDEMNTKDINKENTVCEVSVK